MFAPRFTFLRTAAVAACVAVPLLTPSVAAAAECRFPEITYLEDGDERTDNVLLDANGKEWDVQQDGSFDDGTDDAFDDFGVLSLRVHGVSEDGSPRVTPFEGFPWLYGTDAGCAMSADGRELQFPEVASKAGTNGFGPLLVTRRVRVSAGQPAFGRWVDTVRNPSTEPVTFDLRLEGDFGSDSSTTIKGTSSGDTTLTAADSWIATSDRDVNSDGTRDGDPPLTTLMFSANARATLRPSSVELDSDELTVVYQRVTLAPGASISFMAISMQQELRSEATAAGVANASSGVEGDAVFPERA